MFKVEKTSNRDAQELPSKSPEPSEVHNQHADEEVVHVQQVKYVLAKGSDIVIVDDTILSRLFSPLSAPFDSGLEWLYLQLGAEYLSKKVDRSFEISSRQPSGTGGRVISTRATADLTSRILQRRGLILESSSRPLIKGAHSLLDDGLCVREVADINAVYSLSSVTKKQKVTCCGLTPKESGRTLRQLGLSSTRPLTLLVCGQVDYFDVASALGRKLYARCALQDVFLLAQILETSLTSLRARGFPVDKLVQQQTAQAPEKLRQHGGQDGAGSTTPKAGTDQKSSAGGNSSNLGERSDSATTIPSRAGPEAPGRDSSKLNGYVDILKACHPNADERWIQEQLRSDASEKGLVNLKDRMDLGNFPQVPAAEPKPDSRPKQRPEPEPEPKPTSLSAEEPVQRNSSGSSLHSTSSSATVDSRASSKRSGFSRALARFKGAASSRQGTALATTAEPGSIGAPAPSTAQQASGAYRRGNTTTGVSFGAVSDPGQDARAREANRRALQQSVDSCMAVPPSGVSNPSSTSTIPPVGEQTPDTCDAVPAHELQPVVNAKGSRKTSQGIRVFACTTDGPTALDFCRHHEDVIERFGYVLSLVAAVFGLDIRSVAIYHQGSGRTIAFNANRSLHFNVRFFHTLHDSREAGLAPYVYWFTVMCHELAHNFASGHNKLHEHYMELYIIEYMPGLMRLAQDVSQN